jgi:hypothetical protein
MTALQNHLTEASAPYVFSVNAGVLAVVTLAEVESLLKVALLLASLALTLVSIALKIRNRNKPYV